MLASDTRVEYRSANLYTAQGTCIVLVSDLWGTQNSNRYSIFQISRYFLCSIQGAAATRRGICVVQFRLRIPGCLLVQWFQAVDQDRSNAIDAAELQKALALGNLHFSLAVCAHMIR